MRWKVFIHSLGGSHRFKFPIIIVISLEEQSLYEKSFNRYLKLGIPETAYRGLTNDCYFLPQTFSPYYQLLGTRKQMLCALKDLWKFT